MSQLPDFIEQFNSSHGWDEVAYSADILLEKRMLQWLQQHPELQGIRLDLYNQVFSQLETVLFVGTDHANGTVYNQNASEITSHSLVFYGDVDEKTCQRLAASIHSELGWLSGLQARSIASDIFQTSPIIMYQAAEIDGRWVLTHTNRALLNYLGCELDDLVGQGAEKLLTDYIHPEDLSKILTAYDFARSTSREMTVQYRLRDASGVYKPVTERVSYAPAKDKQRAISIIWHRKQDRIDSHAQFQIIKNIEKFTQDITFETGRSFLDHFCRRIVASDDVQSIALIAKRQANWWETWVSIQDGIKQNDLHLHVPQAELFHSEVWNHETSVDDDAFISETLFGSNAYITVIPLQFDGEHLQAALLLGAEKPIDNSDSISHTVDMFGVRLVREIYQIRIAEAQESQNQLLVQQKQQLTKMVTMLGQLDTLNDELEFLVTVRSYLQEAFDLVQLEWRFWNSGRWWSVANIDSVQNKHWYREALPVTDTATVQYLEDCRYSGRLSVNRKALRVYWPVGSTQAGFSVLSLYFRQALPDTELMKFSQNALLLALQGLVQRENLRYQAMRDSLTGLGNRVQLHAWIKVALPTQSQASLLLFDLNRFKEINDSFGHQFGDKLLMEIGPRITNALADRPHYLARLGGDEFALFFPDTPPEEAMKLAELLHEKLAESYSIDGLRFQVEASVGVAHYPEHGKDGHELLRCSDVAMYAAKNSNRKVVVFNSELDTTTPLRIAVLSELDQALTDNQLWVAYQPLMSTETGQTAGFEALIRWTHPEFGPLSPGEFIPIAEMGEGIRKITDFVLRQTLNFIREWKTITPNLHVAVNISPRVLLDHMFPHNVKNLLDEYGLPGNVIVMELTESTLLVDPVRAIEIINALAELGIKVEIDDFGTGYSSLAYLKSLPISALKIDRSFVTDILEHTQNEVIVQSTVQMAHSLGLQTVAEGVEDEATLLKMMRLGCDMIQGYYYSKPLPGSEISDWLTRNTQ